MGYCPFSSSGRDTTGLYCDKQGAGAPGHDTAWPVCWGVQQRARHGVQRARHGFCITTRFLCRDKGQCARSNTRCNTAPSAQRHGAQCAATWRPACCYTVPSALRHDAQRAATWCPARGVGATLAQCALDLGLGCAHCAHDSVLR